MGETAPFRRTWRVTVLRGVVACVPAVALAALIASGQQETRRLGQFGESLLGLVMLPAIWLVLGGAWLDHKQAARGPGYLLGAHVLGSLAALVLGVAVGNVLDAFVGGRQPFEGLSFTLWIVAIPPWVSVGFLAAWLVPGSFPRRRAAVPVASGA